MALERVMLIVSKKKKKLFILHTHAGFLAWYEAWIAILRADHDDVIKWKHFPRYWLFVWGIHVTDDFPTQRPVTRSFDVFFNLCLNKRLSKQSWGWWFRHRAHYDVIVMQNDIFQLK